MIRVLVVDDNPDLRSVIKLALEAAGYSVQVARDGLSALAMQSATPADIVITDLSMPGADGFTAITTLRKAFPRVKIIAMSGGLPLIKADPVAAAAQIGADAAVAKPFELHTIVDLVRSFSRPAI